MAHIVTSIYEDGPTQWVICYSNPDEEGGYCLGVPREAVYNRMATYGITDPTEALDVIVHEYHWMIVRPSDPRDDPALVEGWVTSTTPDSEPIHLYAAYSGADAAGAAWARITACRAHVQLQGLADHAPTVPDSPDRVRHHRELVDTMRWQQVYGGLPLPPRSRRPRIPLEASRA